MIGEKTLDELKDIVELQKSEITRLMTSIRQCDVEFDNMQNNLKGQIKERELAGQRVYACLPKGDWMTRGLAGTYPWLDNKEKGSCTMVCNCYKCRARREGSSTEDLKKKIDGLQDQIAVLVRNIREWACCTDIGMRAHCPERVEELATFLISNGIAPYSLKI